tara:strand:+ start:120 stop:308 length:189 start_codon:yes stop_codon:yes gene_type:complete
MSYIIVHVDDPGDLESMDVLPTATGDAVKKFNSKVEASTFLSELGVSTEIWYNNDIHILRLH